MYFGPQNSVQTPLVYDKTKLKSIRISLSIFPFCINEENANGKIENVVLLAGHGIIKKIAKREVKVRPTLISLRNGWFYDHFTESKNKIKKAKFMEWNLVEIICKEKVKLWRHLLLGNEKAKVAKKKMSFKLGSKGFEGYIRMFKVFINGSLVADYDFINISPHIRKITDKTEMKHHAQFQGPFKTPDEIKEREIKLRKRGATEIDESLLKPTIRTSVLDFCGSGDFTFMCWVRVEKNAVGFIGNLLSGEEFTISIYSNGRIHLNWMKEIIFFSHCDLRDSLWHHICVIRRLDKNSFEIWVDGELDSENMSCGSNCTIISPHTLGSSVFRHSDQIYFQEKDRDVLDREKSDPRNSHAENGIDSINNSMNSENLDQDIGVPNVSPTYPPQALKEIKITRRNISDGLMNLSLNEESTKPPLPSVTAVETKNTPQERAIRKISNPLNANFAHVRIWNKSLTKREIETVQWMYPMNWNNLKYSQDLVDDLFYLGKEYLDYDLKNYKIAAKLFKNGHLRRARPIFFMLMSSSGLEIELRNQCERFYYCITYILILLSNSTGIDDFWDEILENHVPRQVFSLIPYCENFLDEKKDIYLILAQMFMEIKETELGKKFMKKAIEFDPKVQNWTLTQVLEYYKDNETFPKLISRLSQDMSDLMQLKLRKRKIYQPHPFFIQSKANKLYLSVDYSDQELYNGIPVTLSHEITLWKWKDGKISLASDNSLYITHDDGKLVLWQELNNHIQQEFHYENPHISKFLSSDSADLQYLEILMDQNEIFFQSKKEKQEQFWTLKYVTSFVERQELFERNEKGKFIERMKGMEWIDNLRKFKILTNEEYTLAKTRLDKISFFQDIFQKYPSSHDAIPAIKSMKRLKTFQKMIGNVLHCSILVDGGKKIVIGTNSNVQIYDFPSLKQKYIISRKGCRSIDFDSAKNIVALASYDHTIHIHSLEEGFIQLSVLAEHSVKNPIIHLVRFASKQRIVTAGEDGKIKVWDIATADCLGIISMPFRHHVLQMEYIPFHDSILISTTQFMNMKIVSLNNLDVMDNVGSESCPVKVIHVDANKDLILSVDSENVLRVFQVSTSQMIVEEHFMDYTITGVSIDNQAKVIALSGTFGMGHSITFMELQSCRTFHEIAIPFPILPHSLHFCSRDNYLSYCLLQSPETVPTRKGHLQSFYNILQERKRQSPHRAQSPLKPLSAHSPSRFESPLKRRTSSPFSKQDFHRAKSAMSQRRNSFTFSNRRLSQTPLSTRKSITTSAILKKQSLAIIEANATMPVFYVATWSSSSK